MSETKLYAKGDFEAARQRAEEVLQLTGSVRDESGLLIPDGKVRLAMILQKLGRNEQASNLAIQLEDFVTEPDRNSPRPTE